MVRTGSADNIGRSDNLNPRFRIIGKGLVDRAHIRDKVRAIPLSTEPLQAQECMASQADQSRRIVIHNRIGHGDCTDGIVPPKSAKSQQLSVTRHLPAPRTARDNSATSESGMFLRSRQSSAQRLDLGCGSQAALHRSIHVSLPSQTGMFTGEEDTTTRTGKPRA